ncbi:MAG: hypothetical protein JWO63_1877 [Frankiales bacterium]|jgi:hypothetical protein|nr:hypothetical protein [Frankiales bacterium]
MTTSEFPELGLRLFMFYLGGSVPKANIEV